MPSARERAAVNEGSVSVRSAILDEHSAVMNVLDGALLATEASVVGQRIDRGVVLVAVEDDRILAACVLDPGAGAHVDAIAVRPRRRGEGIGRTLLETAADRYGRLTADFDERVRGFYDSLGFDVESDGDRYRGEWNP